MVYFDLARRAAFVAELAERGVRVAIVAERVRAVTHLGVDDGDVDRALAVVAEVVASGNCS
jgi:hypothetical protein